MNITLLVPETGFSFVNQAEALAKGFIMLGLTVTIDRVTKNLPWNDFGSSQPDIIIAIGSWVHYQELVEKPMEAGFRVVPWFVSDDCIDHFRNELNGLPLLLTTSKYCKSVFTRDGITAHIEVIPEAVDPEFWNPQTAEDQRVAGYLSLSENNRDIPEQFNISKLKKIGVPILFTTGGDATSKGALETIQALGAINKKDPGLPWVYLLKTWPSAGSLRRSADELDLADKLGIANRIRYMVGEYSKEFLCGLMNLCEIYVAPSRTEGFGLPHVEAAMCKKPVIGLSANASGESIIDGKTGFIINTDVSDGQMKANIPDLTEALTKLLTDAALRHGMGESARIHAVKIYSPKIIAQQFLDIFSAQKF